MNRILGVVLFSLLIVSSAFSIKYDVALFEFDNLGLSEKDYKIAMHLLRDELENIESFSMISQEDVKKVTGDKIVTEPKKAIALGKQLRVDKCIIGSFVPLGDKIVVRFKMVDVKEETLEFYDEVESDSFEDLNTVLRRVAMGLESKQKFESTATTDTVTEDEVTGLRKRQSFHCYGLRLGYLYPQDDTFGAEDRLSAFVATWQFETPKIIAQFDFSMFGAHDALDLSFDMSFLYPLSRTDISPYISAGLGMHFLSIREEVIDPLDLYESFDWKGKSGFALNGGGGFIFFRTYNFRVIFDFKVYYLFVDLGEKENQYGAAFTFGFLMRHQDKKKRF